MPMEGGCNFYPLHQSRSNSQSSSIVFEQYTDEAPNGKTEYFGRIGAQMGARMAAALEIELFDSL